MPHPRRLLDEQAELVRNTFAQRRSIARRLADLRTELAALKAELRAIPSAGEMAVELGVSRRALFDLVNGTTYKRVAHVDGNEEG